MRGEGGGCAMAVGEIPVICIFCRIKNIFAVNCALKPECGVCHVRQGGGSSGRMAECRRSVHHGRVSGVNRHPCSAARSRRLPCAIQTSRSTSTQGSHRHHQDRAAGPGGVGLGLGTSRARPAPRRPDGDGPTTRRRVRVGTGFGQICGTSRHL